jgi:hypothetical protein
MDQHARNLDFIYHHLLLEDGPCHTHVCPV